MAEEEKMLPAEPAEEASACAACAGCENVPAVRDETPVTVVDVRFREDGKAYYFDPGEMVFHPGDAVIMDTARGEEYGICASENHTVRRCELVPPLRAILRRATEKDEQRNRENRKKEKEAFDICLQKIAEHRLDMQLVSAECAFDGSKLLFFFTADGRVDFRELVKNLASVFHTRIELRQIGVRDKAKMVGGLGICGRPFCCREFLADFQPVSIKMAKTQNLSLNPTKISGTCGRLMCCLKYEQDAYEDLLSTVPKVESFVDTPGGRGTVTDTNLLRQTVRVRMEKSPDAFNTYPVSDVYVIRSGKARKTDTPIPEDFAPISAAQTQKTDDDPMPQVAFRERPSRARAPAPEPPAEAAQSPDANAADNRGQNRGRSARRRGDRAEKSAAQEPKSPDKTEKKVNPENTEKSAEQPHSPRPQNRNNRRHRRPSPGNTTEST